MLPNMKKNNTGTSNEMTNMKIKAKVLRKERVRSLRAISRIFIKGLLAID